MRQRLISAAVLVPIVVIVFVAGFPWTWLGIAALGAAGAFEAARLVRAAGLPANTTFAFAVTLAASLAIPFTSNAQSFFDPWPDLWVYLVLGFVAVVVIGAAVIGLADRDPRSGFLRWSGNVLASLYPSLLAFVIALQFINPGIPDSALLAKWLDGGRAWLLILVATVWSLDSAAYLSGRYVPRGHFMNHISPNKTWSGVIGGTFAALLVCTLLVWAAGQSPLGGIALGLVIAVSAQAGDLAESMLKRAAGAKDSGAIMPGHGGVLDRIDSFLFAGPAMFVTLVIAMRVLNW